MFYVYEWYVINTNEIFYVGKGHKKRAGQKTKRNKIFTNYIKKYNCKYRIAKYFEKEADAFKYEHERICELKSKGLCKANLDDGGKGGVEFIWTPEMRDYHSKYNAMKSDKQRKRMSINNPMKNKDVAKRVGESIRKHPIIDGIRYSHIEDACKYYHVCSCTIRTWCKRGINPNGLQCYYEGDSHVYTKYINPVYKQVVYKNVLYPSVKNFANAIGISESTANTWLKNHFDTKGNSCKYANDDNTYIFKKENKLKRPIKIDGILYESVADAARKLGFKRDTALHYHIHNHTNRFQVEYCDKDK